MSAVIKFSEMSADRKTSCLDFVVNAFKLQGERSFCLDLLCSQNPSFIVQDRSFVFVSTTQFDLFNAAVLAEAERVKQVGQSGQPSFDVSRSIRFDLSELEWQAMTLAVRAANELALKLSKDRGVALSNEGGAAVVFYRNVKDIFLLGSFFAAYRTSMKRD
jgi:hypothetical protein